MMWFIHQTVGVLTNPLMLLFSGMGIGVVLWRRWKRVGSWVLGVTLGVTWICAMPFTTENLAKWIEADYYPVKAVETLPEADAIVLLGGGVWAAGEGNDWPYPDLKEAADRAWHAARIWHAGKASKIYCTCPDVSRSTPPFLKALGIPEEAIVPLDGPRNTEEEAKRYEEELSRLCQPQPSTSTSAKPKVLLVTSASHMKRATRIFAKYAPSLEVVPAAIDFMYIEPVEQEFNIKRYLPSVGSLCGFNALLHELLGLVRYAW